MVPIVRYVIYFTNLEVHSFVHLTEIPIAKKACLKAHPRFSRVCVHAFFHTQNTLRIRLRLGASMTETLCP